MTGSVIVAEGVERDGERQALEDLGLLYGQGWLFSRAMPVVTARQRMPGVGTVAARRRSRGSLPCGMWRSLNKASGARSGH